MIFMQSLKSFILEAKQSTKDKKKHTEGISLLQRVFDQQNSKNQETEEIKSFSDIIRPNGPTIYAFTTNKIKDAIKIGYTDRLPEERIAEWKEIYGKGKDDVELLGYWSSEELDNANEKVFFWDHTVHKQVTKRGFRNLKKDKMTNTFFIEDLTDLGKTVIDLHFSNEFFSKYKQLLKGKLDSEEKEELSKELLNDIIEEIKRKIRSGELDDSIKVYKFDKEGKTTTKKGDIHWKEPAHYSNTGLQNDAINAGVKAISEGKKSLLMAAVMRFGKTHACYEIINQFNEKYPSKKITNVIVTTAKPDVVESWRNDINHINYIDHKNPTDDFVFIEVIGVNKYRITFRDRKANPDKPLLTTKEGSVDMKEFDELTNNSVVIYFASLQDLAGSIEKIKNKHKNVFTKNFDLVIVDESHYGSHSPRQGKAIKLNNVNVDYELVEDEEQATQDLAQEETEIEKDKKSLSGLSLNYKVILQVSGTPYYILASNEMNGLLRKDAEVISTVSYSDMLNARNNWPKEHPNEKRESSPYFGVPTLHKIGLNLTDECKKIAGDKGINMSFRKLFAIKNNEFVYEKELIGLMKTIFGDGSGDSLALLDNKKVDGKKVCKHTMIVLPNIPHCPLMAKLLKEHVTKNNREIIQLSGSNEIANVAELNNKMAELEERGKKSIILTVIKYLTGVSMPYLDSMIYMKNTKSSQDYDQAIFRLCTRNVRKVNEEQYADLTEEEKKKAPKVVNMKENVYLIDLNVDNMFDMLKNSAIMKADADSADKKKNKSKVQRIKEYMEQDLSTVPIYSDEDTQGKITGAMHELKLSDMLKLYADYNDNRSISDSILNEINQFEGLFRSRRFQNEIAKMDKIIGDDTKITGPGKEEEDTTDINLDNFENQPNDTSNKDNKVTLSKQVQKSSKEMDEIIKLVRKRFTTILKLILCCNLCLDDPYPSFEDMVKDLKANKNEKLKTMIEEFSVKTEYIETLYDVMPDHYRIMVDKLLLGISLVSTDGTLDVDKFMKSISGIGRISQNEVITPQNVVKKMIEKLDDSEYISAKNILLINEKQGEFFKGLYDKFKDDIVDKCKIIPSSTIGKNLTIKLLKSLGLNDYINNIIVPMEDYNENGRIEVTDFIDKKLNDKEMEKITGNKHFNICLMNPPYSRSTHLKFLTKTIQISDDVISIQPVRWINDPNAKYNNKSALNKYENSIAKHIKSLEIIPDKEAEQLFGAAFTMDLGIYHCDKVGGYNYKELSEDRIFDNVISKMKDTVKNHLEFSEPKNAIVVSLITGGNNGRKSHLIDLFWTFNKDITGLSDYKTVVYDKEGKRLDNGLTFRQNREKTAWGNVKVRGEQTNIKFKNVQECINFFEYTRLDLFRYMYNKSVVDVHVHPERLPFMDDYSKKWTNKMLYDYFDISEEDRIYITNYIKDEYEALKTKIQAEYNNKKHKKSK